MLLHRGQIDGLLTPSSGSCEKKLEDSIQTSLSLQLLINSNHLDSDLYCYPDTSIINPKQQTSETLAPALVRSGGEGCPSNRVVPFLLSLAFSLSIV